MIGRRAAIARAGASLLPLPTVLSAQPAPHRVGVLAPFAQPTLGEVLQVLHEGLRAQGLEPGRDVLIEVRHSDQPARDLDALAAELAAWKPTVVVALGPTATERMLRATAAAPMPIVSFGDLVAASHADQLGRPGGRLRGAKPSELPIEQPTKIELAVNLRTARAIGATLPRALLLRTR